MNILFKSQVKNKLHIVTPYMIIHVKKKCCGHCIIYIIQILKNK